MSRKTARRHVFAVVFQFPFHKTLTAETLEAIIAEYLSGLEDETVPVGEDMTFIQQEVLGVFDCCQAVDEKIAALLRDWEIERIAKTDLALLRLALYEMLYAADIPVGVSINEAVELAKIYGTDDSPAFINGALGSAVRRFKLAAGEQNG